MKSRIYQNNEIKHVCSCTKKQKQIFIFQTKNILQNCWLLLEWPILVICLYLCPVFLQLHITNGQVRLATWTFVLLYNRIMFLAFY